MPPLQGEVAGRRPDGGVSRPERRSLLAMTLCDDPSGSHGRKYQQERPVVRIRNVQKVQEPLAYRHRGAAESYECEDRQYSNRGIAIARRVERTSPSPQALSKSAQPSRHHPLRKNDELWGGGLNQIGPFLFIPLRHRVPPFRGVVRHAFSVSPP